MATDTPRPERSSPALAARVLRLERAAARVMLGAPPALVAADLGCDVATLMHWVKAHRRQLRRTLRESAVDAAAAPAPAPAERAERGMPLRARNAERQFLADRPVAPEDSAVVEAAYRAAEFDYSGRRVRAAAH